MTFVISSIAVLITVLAALYWAYRRGRDTQQKENQKDVIDAIQHAKDTRDRLDRDAGFRDRIRQLFTRTDK